MDLSLKNLEEAVSIRRGIDRLQAQLNVVLGKIGGAGGKTGGRRTLSPAARAKIAAAARARWAKHRKSGSGKKRKRGGITPAGRRKLSQLMKARWAARRKRAGKKS